MFTTKSDVTLLRPDKLRVITFGDGPPSEFYYNGKTMMAFAPAENLVAVADAPPTIDAALKSAFDSAAIYFPFTDLIVADPYKDIADGLELAFYIGQSNVVGGTTTDMVAYATSGVFVQAWIGAEDKLPRMVRAVYLNDPAQLRHEMELSNWQLDPAVASEFFESAKAAAATPMGFAHPARSSHRMPSPHRGAKPPSHPARPNEEARRIMNTIAIGFTGLLITALGPAPLRHGPMPTATVAAPSTRTERVPNTPTRMAAVPRMLGAAAASIPTCTAAPRQASTEKAHTTPVPTARPPTIRPRMAAPTTIRRPITRHPPAYHPYHPPVAVPYYSSSGCYGCAAAAGAVVGMAAGAAIASSNTAAATSSAYSAGVAAGSANTASAYNAGVAAGASYAMGVNYATLPPGAMSINKGGTTYYLSGNTWFQPAYGANGVYYRVVPAP